MFYVSEISEVAPATYKSDLQKRVFGALNDLHIPFQRVDTDEAITMDDCVMIDQRLQMKMVKTLFLCNRQQTEFYLFITCGDKSFRSKDFSHALGISRVSFAPAEMLLTMLHTHVGAATVLSMLEDDDNRVKVVMDKDVTAEEWYGCSDGTTTGYMKLRTDDVMNVFLPFVHHQATVIEV
jgi:Ala-tRNA(Pro) deacylase